ncbi:hypothetical protein CLOSTHATH_05510 [Hungatella hathewayi DSM 13479]|uniref:Uncharacterized protein n=1 Tax=Hungatella hathewayi DSM 13479 TaxID=566550 RepID=D3APF8_9FIRM|nr:hypothetical protein CLOSTHATH_05510 [Hungatella hathewayi DSM 13479]
MSNGFSALLILYSCGLRVSAQSAEPLQVTLLFENLGLSASICQAVILL